MNIYASFVIVGIIWTLHFENESTDCKYYHRFETKLYVTVEKVTDWFWTWRRTAVLSDVLFLYF